MKYSKRIFSIILTPNNGKLLKNKGNKAQWIAHAIEVAIPNASQLIFSFISTKLQQCNFVAKYLLQTYLTFTH